MSGTAPIKTRIIAEDGLLEAIGIKLISLFSDKYDLITTRATHGKEKLNIQKWNNASKNLADTMYLVLCDMDSLAHPEDPGKCPASEIKRMLGEASKSERLTLRLAVAMGENWLIADRDRLCKFLSCNIRAAPRAPDRERNGKKAIFNMARKSKDPDIRKDIPPPNPPPKGRRAPRTGPLYNDKMGEFIREKWAPREAMRNSKSLRRAIERLETFQLS